uniref:Uncharacterized protein n=1 Tax=Candidatus Kentrum sp. LPFa TaxID=2126335 RepID=A0A450WB81_9GAMM|nr:MAG: hypothetical protein BECKLPF1236B_GA0070989_105915 [Candidatus Kentron sp. LPFa]
MATPDDIDAELTLEISGQNVTPEKFEDNKNSDTVIPLLERKTTNGADLQERCTRGEHIE